MDLFELRADSNHFQNLTFADEADVLAITEQFNGQPVKGPWPRPRVVPMIDDSKGLPPSDFPNLYGLIPVFSPRAIDGLRALLERSGELLPLASQSGYYAFNATSVIDVLDESASQVDRFPDGRVMLIKRHAFVADVERCLVSTSIFKIPQRRRGSCYVTDSFVSAARRHQLTGFIFRAL